MIDQDTTVYHLNVVLKQDVSVKVLEPLLFMKYVTTPFPGLFKKELVEQKGQSIVFKISYKNIPVCYVVFKDTGVEPDLLKKNVRSVCNQAAKDAYPEIQEAVLEMLSSFIEFRKVAEKKPIGREPDDLTAALAYLNIVTATILGAAISYLSGNDSILGASVGFMGSVLVVTAIAVIYEVPGRLNQIIGLAEKMFKR